MLPACRPTTTPADVRAPRTTSRPPSRDRLRALRVPMPAPELLVLLALAAVLNLWALDRNGWANTTTRPRCGRWRRAGTTSSTTRSTPPALQTVDKPPLALWVQALSVRAFGFNSWAMLVPQALMGVGTVALAYDLTRRASAAPAGFVAGLVAGADADHGRDLAPQQPGRAARAVRRPRALWFAVRALRRTAARGGWCWAGVLVGLGFETKMARGAAGRPGARARVAVGGAARPRRRGARSCSPAAPRWPRSGSRGRC